MLDKTLAMTTLICTIVCGCNMVNEPVPAIAVTSESTTIEAVEILDHYRSLGKHRSGSHTDKATSVWLQSELQTRGISADLQEWPLDVFELVKSSIEASDRVFETFPFWYPVATGPKGIEAPLAIADGAEEGALTDSIAVFRLPPGQFEVHYDVAPVLQDAADKGALAAVIILDHPIKAVSAQNANRPYHQQSLPIPALIASEADAEELLTLATNKKSVHLIIDGENQQTRAMNVIGEIDRGADQWVVISTPISGWFEATNERGPGIAMWLQLAQWAKHSDLDANFLFTALSGHELGKMGMEALVDSGELPTPDSVALWLHLGSGIAVKTPLISAVSSVTTLSDIVHDTLISNTAMMYLPEDKMPKASEQYRALQLGYPVVGLFGAGPNIHTRHDQKPRIDDAEYNKVFSALQELIRRQLDVGPPKNEEVK